MDIQSFLLGMGVVLLIASAIGGVIALVKLGKLKVELENKEKGRLMEMQSVYHEFEDVRRTMDSRFDKFENKVSSPDFFNSPERIERIKELINKT